MNKIFVSVYVPYLDETFDMFIPVNKKVGTIKQYMIKNIRGLEINNYNFVLKSDGKVIEDNSYVQGSGITNGSKLILL